MRAFMKMPVYKGLDIEGRDPVANGQDVESRRLRPQTRRQGPSCDGDIGAARRIADEFGMRGVHMPGHQDLDRAGRERAAGLFAAPGLGLKARFCWRLERVVTGDDALRFAFILSDGCFEIIKVYAAWSAPRKEVQYLS